MVGKGKLICRAGQVALLLENYGSGEVFKLGLLSDASSDEIQASVFLSMSEAVFLQHCMKSCIDTLFAHNVQEQWYGDETSETSEKESS